MSKTHPSHRSFMSVEGRNVVLSSLKKAESGEALILRLHNPSDVPAQATIQLPFSPVEARLVRLDEPLAAAAETVPVLEADGKIRVALAPKRIITLRMDRA